MKGAQWLMWHILVYIEVSHVICYCQDGIECCRGETYIANALALNAIVLLVEGEG